MRLAFITSLLTTRRADTGFDIANAAILETLKAAGCEVVQFGFLRPDDPEPEASNVIVLKRMTIENAVASRFQKATWLADSIRRGLPVISTKIAAYGEKRLGQVLYNYGPFDGYILNSAPVAGAFPTLLNDKPFVLVAHNVEHKSAHENAVHTSGITQKLYKREAKLLEAIEHRTLAAARFVWCFAEEDRKGFGVDIDNKSSVLPLILPTPDALPAVSPAYDIGLIGTWTWQPNLVGLRWFLDEVAPLLGEGITVGVAGRMPAGIEPPNANVKFLGRVPDAAEFVASCRVMALTSRTGTGIQLKTIETFQTGKPSVATLSSVRGFSDLPINCLVADNAADFANAITKLARDVAAERTQSVDGSAFSEARKKQMLKGIQQGLLALKQG
ncbi:MAG: glycosyltransferase [Beijerinckiaceae bacterium]